MEEGRGWLHSFSSADFISETTINCLAQRGLYSIVAATCNTSCRRHCHRLDCLLFQSFSCRWTINKWMSISLSTTTTTTTIMYYTIIATDYLLLRYNYVRSLARLMAARAKREKTRLLWQPFRLEIIYWIALAVADCHCQGLNKDRVGRGI